MSSVNSITFSPTRRAVASFEADAKLYVKPKEAPRLALLRTTAPTEHRKCIELLHSSLPENPDAMPDIIPHRNGFVHTVTTAYNEHRALIIRPDDVWLAILTQFSFFVNGNAEALRSTFVAHEGKKDLIVRAIANRYTMAPAQLAYQMTKLMEEHIVDESLREWIMPNFSTTATTDKAISAIVMMGTMKEYFSYEFHLLCGIPRVTLEGEKRDWEEILRRLERLKKYGMQTIAWYQLLRPIISRFVAAYDDPNSQSNLDFWNKVAHRLGFSGPIWLSGWITAFCVFDEEGQWQGNRLLEEPYNLGGTNDPLLLNGGEFASAYFYQEEEPYLVLDGMPYPQINSVKIPLGHIHVDVKLDDNGELFETMFVAGLVGSQVSSTEPVPHGKRNTVRPFAAWWYFIKGEKVTVKGSGVK